jgi:hypothetical protein
MVYSLPIPQNITCQGLLRPYFSKIGLIAGSIGVIRILHPFNSFLYSAGIHIDGQIRFCTGSFTQIKKLMCAKTVFLTVIAPG